MNRYWFKPKKYGWGFVPASWEGWLMTLILVCVIFLSVYSNGFFDVQGPALREVARYIFDLIIVITLFSIIAEKKTEGSLRMRWGDRKDKAEDQEGPITPQ